MNKYNYKQIGAGQDVLMVHGWGGSIKSLEALANKLSGSFRVTLLELPGHGESPTMTSTWGTDNFKDFVLQFIDDKNLDNIIYIGHSFGGHTGMKMCIENSVKIEKLILINSSGLKPRNSKKKMFWKAISFVLKPILNTLLFPVKKTVRFLIYKYIIRETDYVKTSGNLKESLKKVLSESIDHEVSAISKPTLLIWADKDTYTPLWMGIKLNETIQNSKLIVMEGTHNLPIKSPEEVSEKIINWINGEKA